MAEPFRFRDKWYLRINFHDRGWANVPTAARNKSEAKRLGIELQLKEDRIRHGLDAPPQQNCDEIFGEMVQWWIDADLAKSRSYLLLCAASIRPGRGRERQEHDEGSSIFAGTSAAALANPVWDGRPDASVATLALWTGQRYASFDL